MALLDQVEEFQATMDNVLELVEETKSLAGHIPDVSLAEAPAKMRAIFDLCAEAMTGLQNATSQAEDVQRMLGG